MSLPYSPIDSLRLPTRAASTPDSDPFALRLLCCAVLMQAVRDLRHDDATIRTHTLAWWQSPAVAWWDEALDLQGQLLRYAAMLPAEAGAVQLGLFGEEA